MPQQTHSFRRGNTPSLGVNLMLVVLAGSFMSCGQTRDGHMATPSPTPQRPSQYMAIKTSGGIAGDRTVVGKVMEVTSNEIKVDTGELQPRFLPLNLAKEKGMTVRKGDTLQITLNEQNLVVDYHPVGKDGDHRVITGALATPLTIGQDRAVIRTEQGTKEDFEIQSQVRSKVAAIPVGVSAVFLIDETNKIADATFGSREAVERARAEWQKKSPIKGAHQKVAGTIMRPFTANKITIRTEDGKEQPFEVREIAQGKLANLPQGERVILMIDNDNQVVDVAVAPHSKG